MTYAEAANLAVNQTLVRSINTSIVALIPVGAILYVGVFQLGSGSLKDLALALFVGMAVGPTRRSSSPRPCWCTSRAARRACRSRARALRKRRHDADRYASVPAYRDDLPVRDDDDRDDDQPAAPRRARRPAPPARRVRTAAGRGRVGPRPRGPSNRPAPPVGVQPTRQSRSKRGKK